MTGNPIVSSLRQHCEVEVNTTRADALSAIRAEISALRRDMNRAEALRDRQDKEGRATQLNVLAAGVYAFLAVATVLSRLAGHAPDIGKVELDVATWVGTILTVGVALSVILSGLELFRYLISMSALFVGAAAFRFSWTGGGLKTELGGGLGLMCIAVLAGIVVSLGANEKLPRTGSGRLRQRLLPFAATLWNIWPALGVALGFAWLELQLPATFDPGREWVGQRAGGLVLSTAAIAAGYWLGHQRFLRRQMGLEPSHSLASPHQTRRLSHRPTAPRRKLRQR